MSFFSRFLGNPLDQPPRTTAEHLVRLMEENNALQRELIFKLTGQPARTGTTVPPRDRKPRTASDVQYVTRDTVLRQERAEEEKRVAPHRSGPASGSAPSPTTPPSAPPTTTSPTPTGSSAGRSERT